MYNILFKRVFDLCISTALIVFLSPLFLIIALLLALQNKGKILFYQLRPGFAEKTFTLYKFKTMFDKTDSYGNMLPDELRITLVGKSVRKLSLDELPQLVNVLKGDMSLIGPRPLLLEYLPLYNQQQKLRHTVRPGITGWAQVNGRNAITWAEKFDFDIWYVRNMSFKVDVKIFLLTILRILKRDGINTTGFATTPKFNGNN